MNFMKKGLNKIRESWKYRFLFLVLSLLILSSCNTLVYLFYLLGVDKDYSIKDKAWLDNSIREWQPEKYYPMKFGVDTQIFVGMGELETDEKNLSSYAFSDGMLDVFLELDLDVIRVGVLDDAWRLGKKKEIELSDRLIKKIRKSGKKLFLADTQHSPYLLENKVSWKEFQKIHLERLELFAKRYKPDYFCVVTEPSVYHDFGIKGGMDPEKWLIQTRKAADLVKKINSKIKTIVSVRQEHERDDIYLKQVFTLKNVDIVGVEAYYPDDLRKIREVLQAIPDRHGKKIWITESWNGMPFPYTTVKDKAMEDAEWIRAVTYFAQKHGFEGLFLWPFQYFVTYERFDNKEGRIDFSKRTESYRSFRKVISEVKNKTSR